MKDRRLMYTQDMRNDGPLRPRPVSLEVVEKLTDKYEYFR